MVENKNQNIFDFFEKAIKTNQLSHGYLFFGGERDEMKKAALWLAESLKTDPFDILCITPLEDKKPACRQAGTTTIAQIRSAKKHLSLSPYNSLYKFVIIERTETLNIQAANAILKTLEEPRGNAILILIAVKPDLLPKTIVSRLQHIRFKSQSLNKIADNFIKEEHIGVLEKPIADKFKYIEKIAKENKDLNEIISLLDSWLFWFRGKMIKDQKYAEVVKEIQKTKDLISSTNINQRLALENLILNII